MDLEKTLQRDPNIALRLLTMCSIVLWIVYAAASLIRSTLLPRADTHSPYWAEEGQSENIPALKHKY